MAAITAQVILKTTDGISANFFTNSLAFDYTNSGANLDATTTAIATFYSSLVSDVLGVGLQTTGHAVKYYLAGGTKPNYPQREDSWDFSTGMTQPALPREVALVASFQAVRISGQEQARKRGRIYIGPLRASINDVGRPSSSARTALANACDAFGTEIAANTDGYWGVYSTVNGTVSEIADGWVDDTFDTQRRRGLAPSARTTWSL